MSGNREKKDEEARKRNREKHENSCRISVDRLMNMVMESAAEAGGAGKSRGAPIRRTMFRVPDPIRKVSKECYDPRLMSFGLYNKRVHERWGSMEKVKHEVASTVLRVLWEERQKRDVEFRALEEKEKAKVIWSQVCENVFSKGRRVSSSVQYGDYIWKLYDDPPRDLSSSDVKHLLLLDAMFLVSFMIFFHTNSSSKSIALTGFRSYKPLLQIFTRAGILCNLNMIAGDIWLFENQIPLSLIRKMVRQMYIQEKNSGAYREKAAAERAFETLVRETVIRGMRVLPGGYRNDPTQEKQESEIGMLFRSINLRRCNHLLECLYRMICPRKAQGRSTERKEESSRSDSRQMISSEEKSLESGWFESLKWGNALVSQHSMFRCTTSDTESASARSLFGRLSPLSSFKDRVESFKSGNAVGMVHSMFNCAFPPQQTDGIEQTGSSRASSNGPGGSQAVSLKAIKSPYIDSNHGQSESPMGPYSDSKPQEQIMARAEVAIIADRDVSESCSLGSETGDSVRKITKELTSSQVYRQVLEDIEKHISENGLPQSSCNIHSNRVQSQEQLTWGSSQHFIHQTLGTENGTTSNSTQGLSNLGTHEIVSQVSGLSSAAVLRTSSRQSLSFRYIINSVEESRKRLPRINSTSLHTAINMNFYTLPTVSNLREVGIGVKGDSYPGCKVELKRSSWRWGSSTLHISQLNVDGNTERFLRNLVAFEIVSTSEHKLLTYLQCLDDLINSDEDVRQLKGGEQAVILNCSMNEREVARMFNRMLLNCTVYHNKELQEIRRKVRSYYLQQWRRSLTEFRDRYCAYTKPWVVLSLMVGFLILGLTVLQTTYTVLGSYN